MSTSRPLDSPCSSFGQIVLVNANQTYSLSSSSNLFSLQHVDSSSNIVCSQLHQFLQQWDFSSIQQPLGQLSDKGAPNLFSMHSRKSVWPYPILNEPTCLPFLYTFTPTTTTTQLALSYSSRCSTMSTYPNTYHLLDPLIPSYPTSPPP
jgi:hypothetical protein